MNSSGEQVLSAAALFSRILNTGLCVLQVDPVLGWRPRWWRSVLAVEMATVGVVMYRTRRYPRRLLYLNTASALADTAVTYRSGQQLSAIWASGGRASEVGITAACVCGVSPVGTGLTVLVCLAWLAALLMGRRRGDDISIATLLGATTDPVLTHLGTALATDALRRHDDEAVAYREAAERRAAETAARAEADARDRVLHDYALQTLEAVAGGWELDPEVLRHRARADADHLERLLNGRRPETTDLHDMMLSLVAEAGSWPLDVHLDCDGSCRAVSPHARDAILEAVRELLRNVAKHSGTAMATVAVRQRESTTTFVVSDSGRGFDPATRHRGLGLRHCVHGRIRDAGGTVTIVSTPGRGTTVTISITTEPA